ncbi:MAG: bifunctional nuclease family protein [Thermodesulfobacteriota bacterium]
MIQVHVDRVGLIPDSGSMSVFLKDQVGGRFLIIQVGVFEGTAILQGINKIPSRRPLSHDLLVNLIKNLGAQVQYLVIHNLVDNTYYGRIHLVRKGKEVLLDTRPSDGIAVCVRVGAPIYVDERLSEHFVDEMDLLMAISPSDETVH